MPKKYRAYLVHAGEEKVVHVSGNICEIACWAENAIRAQGDDREIIFLSIFRESDRESEKGHGEQGG